MRKKWMFVLSMILLMFLVACSASTNYPLDVEFDTPLHYQYSSLRYDKLSEYDIYSYLYDDYTDFIAILSKDTTNIELIESWDQYELTLIKLKDIGTLASMRPAVLFQKTSSELNQIAINYEIALTVDDIIRFNDLKAILNTLSGSYFISKTILIEYRLDRSLTEEEIEGLELLQIYYLELLQRYITIDLGDITYEELETNLLILSVPPSAEELELIEIGFNLLVSLIE